MSLPPINSIPPELLGNIFETLRQLSPILFAFKPQSELCPLLLVCKYWTDVAFSTPSLWSQIHLSSDAASRTVSSVQIFSMLKKRLLLLKESSIDITFTLTGSEACSTAAWMLLSSLSFTWRSFTCREPDAQMLDKLYKVSQVSRSHS